MALQRIGRRFTVAEYHRTAEAGILGEDDRFALADRTLAAADIRGRKTEMNMRVAVMIALLVLLALSLSACAPGVNPLENVPPEGGTVAGFWLGLWHGIIAPVTFIISIFRSDVRFYEVHNNGLWYNLGFVLGAGILLGGSSSASRR